MDAPLGTAIPRKSLISSEVGQNAQPGSGAGAATVTQLSPRGRALGEALRAAFGAQIELSPFKCKIRAQELRTNLLDHIKSLFSPG